MRKQVHAIDLWKMSLRCPQRCTDKTRDRYLRIFHKISKVSQLTKVREEGETITDLHRHQ